MLQNMNKTHENHKPVSLDSQIMKIISLLSEELKLTILQYAEYLLDTKSNRNYNSVPSQKNTENPAKRKRRVAGTMTGMIIMSDDFDEPLEELQDYM
jgi:hypothetical protein